MDWFLCKSMDWFLYDNGLRHESVLNKEQETRVNETTITVGNAFNPDHL